MVTLLTDLGAHDVRDRVEGNDLWIAAADLEPATGWSLKPEGFCKDEICVPLPRGREGEFRRDEEVNLARLWRHAGQPLAHDAGKEIWSLGASAELRAAPLADLKAPDFALPDLDGRIHRLSDHRGKKVFLGTWASW
jgi:hypothetical protein